jgi:glycine dehydrogenase subunit 1
MEAPANNGATIACGDFHPLGCLWGPEDARADSSPTHDDMKYISEFKDLMFGLTDILQDGEWGFGEVLFDRTSYGSVTRAKSLPAPSTDSGLSPPVFTFP